MLTGRVSGNSQTRGNATDKAFTKPCRPHTQPTVAGRRVYRGRRHYSSESAAPFFSQKAAVSSCHDLATGSWVQIRLPNIGDEADLVERLNTSLKEGHYYRIEYAVENRPYYLPAKSIDMEIRGFYGPTEGTGKWVRAVTHYATSSSLWTYGEGTNIWWHLINPSCYFAPYQTFLEVLDTGSKAQSKLDFGGLIIYLRISCVCTRAQVKSLPCQEKFSQEISISAGHRHEK